MDATDGEHGRKPHFVEESGAHNHESLHLLRARLRDLRCLNGVHGPDGELFRLAGLQMPCHLSVHACTGGCGGPQAMDVQASRLYAIRCSAKATEHTIDHIKRLFCEGGSLSRGS
jgi:hypothetical protein